MARRETQIDRKYHADSGDLIVRPDGSFLFVTWAEYELQQQIHALTDRIEQIEQHLADARGETTP